MALTFMNITPVKMDRTVMHDRFVVCKILTCPEGEESCVFVVVLFSLHLNIDGFSANSALPAICCR